MERGPPLVVNIAGKPSWKEIRARLQSASVMTPPQLGESDASSLSKVTTHEHLMTPVHSEQPSVPHKSPALHPPASPMVPSPIPTPKESINPSKAPGRLKSPHKQALDRSTMCEVPCFSRSDSMFLFVAFLPSPVNRFSHTAGNDGTPALSPAMRPAHAQVQCGEAEDERAGRRATRTLRRGHFLSLFAAEPKPNKPPRP